MTSASLFKSLADNIPCATDPRDSERVRDFIAHACVISTEGFYNTIAILSQDLGATAPLALGVWRSKGRYLRDGAQALAVNDLCGPIRIVYDVRDTYHPDHLEFEGLPSNRYSLSERGGLNRVMKLADSYGLAPDVKAPPTLFDVSEYLETPHGLKLWNTGNDTFGRDKYGHRTYPLLYLYSTLPNDEGTLSVQQQLSELVYALCLATTTYRVPWLHYDEDTRQPDPQAATLARSYQKRHYLGSPEARALEASIATFILSARFGWDLEAPLAKEFLADNTLLAPEDTDMVAMLQAVHFLESALKAKVSPRLTELRP
ncbi:hypothetical protein [Corynebacterium auriscanis]|uniref:hypothetical protein n=1 Tax=Corynebacterium auriscanis TaxID=99807 RepID=UPI003CEE52F3